MVTVLIYATGHKRSRQRFLCIHVFLRRWKPRDQMKTFAVNRKSGVTQTESHPDVPYQRSASVLQGGCMRLPLTHPREEQEVPSPRLRPPCRAPAMTLSVNLNPPPPVLTSDLKLLSSRQGPQSSLSGGMTLQTVAPSLSENFAAEDSVWRMQLSLV